MYVKKSKYECPVCGKRVKYTKRKGLMDLNIRQVECEGCGKICTVFSFDIDDRERMRWVGGVRGMVGLLGSEERNWGWVRVDECWRSE